MPPPTQKKPSKVGGITGDPHHLVPVNIGVVPGRQQGLAIDEISKINSRGWARSLKWVTFGISNISLSLTQL